MPRIEYWSMNRLFAALLLATAWLDAHAQSSLPPCLRESTRWTNCFGTYTYSNGPQYVGDWRDDKRHGSGTFTLPDGRKYVGEWRDDKRSGEGIEYAANGTIKLAGLWANNRLSQAYKIDRSRFPLDAESAVATAVASEKVERERLAAEVNALRKRNDELEKKIKSQDGGAKQTGVQLVQLCLSRGLKPGSQQFSICIAGGE